MSHVESYGADDWRAVASQSFVPLEMRATDSAFSARMDHRRRGDLLTLASVKTSSVLVDRTARLASRALSDDVHISVQMNAPARVMQHDRVTPILPGAVFLTETHHPFVLDYTAPSQHHIVLQVRRKDLGLPDAVLGRAAGRALLGVNPARDAYRSYVSAFFGDVTRAENDISESDQEIIVALARAMLNQSFGSTEQALASDDAAYAAMMTFIEAQLSSPQLDPDRVAAAAFVSRRAMYAIFAERQATPAGAIRAARIRAASHILADVSSNDASVTEVAFRVGFVDTTTFARAFRRETGRTPREWRAEALAASL